MKKLFKSLFVVIAATATFAGCQKEETNAPAAQTKTVEFFANSIETKTHFGDKNAENKYPTLWDEGDKVKVLMNLERVNDVSGLEKTSEAMKVGDISNDGASARFQVELNADYQMPSYTYYAIVPSSAYSNKDADARKITIVIPKSQTPQSNVLDKTAQVIYAVSETYTTRQNAIALNFKHFTAYGKFALLNLTDKISTVQSVSIEFEGVNNLAGKWDYNVESDTKEVNMGESKITLTTASETDIWFACAPVDVSGKKLTVTVTDVKGEQLVKEVTMPTNCVFESGKISTFSVNMSGIEPPVQEETAKYFQKVTSVPSDWSGTYLIVYETGKVAFDGNLSSLDVASNTISVNIENNTIAYTDVLMRSTFEVAKNGDNYSLKSASGKYIGSTTYDNDIDESTDTKYPNTFSLSNGNVQIGATNTNSGQSIMKYNDTSGQNRFRYYKSGQKDVQLYRLVEGQSGGETPDQPDTPATPVQLIMTDITCSSQTENSLTFTWASVENASKYEVSINGKTEKVDGITYTATGLDAATQYTISVKAVGDGTTYTTSEAKTQTGTTSASLAGEEDEELVKGATYAFEITNSSSQANSWNKLLGGTTNNAINIAGFTGKNVKMGDISWDISASGASNIYFSGQQIGSSSNYISLFELETDSYVGAVESITLTTCSNAGTTTIAVYVDDIQLGSEVTLTNSSTASAVTFKGTSLLQGKIHIKYTVPTAKKNIRITKIQIN